MLEFIFLKNINFKNFNLKTTEKLKIPFNKASFHSDAIKNIQNAIYQGHISGDGSYTKKCSELLEAILKVKRALITTSCTHALEMAAILLNIRDGDEIIAPSYTFVSTVNAFVARGAKPIFIDIKMDTLNMNENNIENLITAKTKAIIPVHYAGVGCEMDKILGLSKKYNIPIVEDNAHGLFAKYKDQYLGTFGTFATQSFHETKNYSCGEGGALLINDNQYIDRAEIVREKGTNRKLFHEGEVDKYSWQDIGSSYLPSDILSAILYPQLNDRKRIQKKRKNVYNYYYNHLTDWAHENQVLLPVVPDYCEQSYHMFYMIMPTLKKRNSFLDILNDAGIKSIFHYVPLHSSKMGLKFGNKKKKLPVTEKISDCLVRLPFFNNISKHQLKYIVNIILSCRL